MRPIYLTPGAECSRMSAGIQFAAVDVHLPLGRRPLLENGARGAGSKAPGMRFTGIRPRRQQDDRARERLNEMKASIVGAKPGVVCAWISAAALGTCAAAGASE